jgi:crotonobetainyl-CoA:carnitine CoA-transferase CaiB-like acyl-CoA transferase
MAVAPLRGLRVLQSGGGIEVAYCTKILADAGADVVFVEPASGHELRHRSITGSDLDGRSSPLFEYLHCSKRGLEDPGTDLQLLYELADAVVTDHLDDTWESLHKRFPHLSAVVVSPFGMEGPWSSRPATDLTLQAASGGMAPRGAPGLAPLMVGGEPSYWFAGSVAAVSLLGVLDRTRRTGFGELIDVSMLETTHLEHGMYPVTFASMAGRPFQSSRGVPVPGIEPTQDGWVGFFVITGQQWLDFCALIGKPEWQQDESLFIAVERRVRAGELQGPIREWTRQRTTDEIVETASLMRIPVAPIGSGETVTGIDHFVSEQWFVRHPDGFDQPRRPYRFGREPIDAPVPAQRLSGTESLGWGPRPRQNRAGDASQELPLEGVRVADFTGFWAGPMAGAILAGLGAEVIHFEGPERPDGIRMNTLRPMSEPQWWEWSPLFCGANTNKRGLCIDLSAPEGHRAALRLLGTCDVMFENFSPRVVEQLGLGPDAVLGANPRIVIVRMPAFGLEGPWRDRVGFAQTIEQSCGLAFLTGYEGEAPLIPNGMCDPLAGAHGAIAALLALAERASSGTGQVVEAPMVGAGLAVAAEQVVEYSAFGNLQRSMGNASPLMFQQVLRGAGEDEWIAVSLPDERTLQAALAVSGGDDTADLERWCSDRPAEDAAEALLAQGVPAARVQWAQEVVDSPQLHHRGFFEQLDHPLLGRNTYISWPARFSAGPQEWNRTASPTMGQHNHEILTELGYGEADITRMRSEGIISEGVLTDQHGW